MIRIGRAGRRLSRRRHGRGARGWLRRARRLALVLAAGAGVLALRHEPPFTVVAVPYERALYPHWLDPDGDCRDAREEALARASLQPVRWTGDGCRVAAGFWEDPYAGWATGAPNMLDVDHLVPLAEAHRSGADRWTAERRAAFANDAGNLRVVAAGTNRSKGDGDPVSWMPPRFGAWCAYAADWVAVKRRWQLGRDPIERWWTDALRWACGQGP